MTWQYRKLRLAAVCIFGLFEGCSAQAQTYEFQVIADSTTPRPDGGVFFRCLYPVLDGNTIILHPTGVRNNLKDSIWAVDLNAGSTVKLAGLDTTVPGGSGDFTQFPAPPILNGSAVVFSGRDSSQRQFASGLYLAPVSGGSITKLASYTTPDPAGGNFTGFVEDRPGGFMISTGGIVFEAKNLRGDNSVYAVLQDGSSLIAVADSMLPLKRPGDANISRFSNPVIFGSTVAFCGQTASDNAGECSELYTANLDDIRAHPDAPRIFTEILNTRTPLPGNGNQKYLTKVIVPGLQISAQRIAFIAADTNSSYRGIFTVTVTGGTIQKIVASGDQLPGLGQLDVSNSFTFAVSGNKLAFKVQDIAGHSALLLYDNGLIRTIISSAGTLNGRQVRFFGDLSAGALSDSRLAFWASLIVSGPGQSDEATALAIPVAENIVSDGVLNAASYVPGAVSPGEIVTITGTGLGPLEPALASIGADFQFPVELAGARVLFDGVPAPLLYVSERQCNAVIPFEVDGQFSVQLVVQYAGRQSEPVTLAVAPATPGLFSVNSTGTGQASVLNEDGSLNAVGNPAKVNSVVSLYGTGEGQTDPPGSDGQISPPILATPRQHVSITIGAIPAELLYAGPAPGLVSGVFQINVRIPGDSPAGNIPVVVTIGDATSQPNMTIAVTR